MASAVSFTVSARDVCSCKPRTAELLAVLYRGVARHAPAVGTPCVPGDPNVGRIEGRQGPVGGGTGIYDMNEVPGTATIEGAMKAIVRAA